MTQYISLRINHAHLNYAYIHITDSLKKTEKRFVEFAEKV